MSSEANIQSIREGCSLPDEWRVRQAGINVEIIADEDGLPADAVIEVIAGNNLTEIVIGHQDMPTRGELIRAAETGEPAKSNLNIPSTIGVLQFDETLSGKIYDVIEQLADVEQLADLAEARNPSGSNPLNVAEAVEVHTNVSLDDIDGTLSSI